MPMTVPRSSSRLCWPVTAPDEKVVVPRVWSKKSWRPRLTPTDVFGLYRHWPSQFAPNQLTFGTTSRWSPSGKAIAYEPTLMNGGSASCARSAAIGAPTTEAATAARSASCFLFISLHPQIWRLRERLVHAEQSALGRARGVCHDAVNSSGPEERDALQIGVFGAAVQHRDDDRATLQCVRNTDRQH